MARNFPLWAAVCLLARVAGLFLFLAAEADAHAVLIASSPANNDILSVPPGKVLLRFNEAVRGVRFSMVAADGVTRGISANSTGAEVKAFLPDPLADGTVIVSYRVVSEDGHPIGGSIVFHVGKPSARSSDVSDISSKALHGVIWLVTIGSTLCLAILVGGAFFSCWFSPAGARRQSATLAALSIMLVLTGLYLQGLDDLGVGLVWTGLQPIAQVFSDQTGAAQCLKLVAIVLAVLPFARRPRSARIAAATALAIASLAFTLTGHSSIAQPRFIAWTAIFLHAGILLFWIGSLPPLMSLCRSAEDQHPLRFFSRQIPIPFAVMLLAGLLLAVTEIPRIDLAWSSLFARVLAVKIGLVAVLCGLALYNRFWLTDPALAGDPVARRWLRWSIGGEIGVALLIVAAASLWRFAGPEQHQYAYAQSPVSLHLHGQKAMAELEMTPQPDGTADIRVSILTPQFDPIQPRSVSLDLRNTLRGIEPLRYGLTNAADGTWAARNLPLSDIAGWSVDLQVLIDDFNLVHLEGDLPAGTE
ncbi:copper resistance CopC/CopD family protein [Rhizobium mesosinicum]|uniref:Copper resistance protein CopC/CopD n=1 Tax=Rhizobium mesosinicum TaxID=335017 RepID=A0ABS7GRE9_9HYPH|nr:copper resistance protein CopC [Rhizobium mesosinicum]MBW9052529.1 copper resistance protein CopC/CopD [Rhizobium mesosinicum]